MLTVTFKIIGNSTYFYRATSKGRVIATGISTFKPFFDDNDTVITSGLTFNNVSELKELF